MQENESSYPLLREYHTHRDWVQLRGNPSGGWTVFLGDSIGCGLWQWRAAYFDTPRDAYFIYLDEVHHARRYVLSRGYSSLEETLIADTPKKGTSE